jgi:Tol biopolymer transport system component
VKDVQDIMKKGNFLPVLVVSLLIFGCGAPASPPQPEVASSTPAVPTLTSTPPLTATEKPPTSTPAPKPETPTLTPEPGLQTNGPYLAYFQQDEHGIRRLVLMDADGAGKKVIELPKAIGESFAIVKPPDPDIRWISPDGRWLAFRTGTAGNSVDVPAQGVSDLTLNLLNLQTGEQQVITPLLSDDYPNNFAEAAGKLNDPYITAQSLYDAFMNGITAALDWSPDGRYLAFAGQMDGLSSDLYVYDVETKTIRRLSSGDKELQWIEWSPNGKWIMHGSTYFVGAGMTFDIYAATIDSTSAPYISTNIQYDGIDRWLNSHQYFENDGENGPGEYGLRLVDVETGGIKKVWNGSFYSYAVEKRGLWVAVLASSPDASPVSADGSFNFDFDFVPAIYLINLATLQKSRVEFADPNSIAAFGLDGRDFVIASGGNAAFLSINGSLTETDLGEASLSVSPNSEYWLAITGQSVRIFSADNTLIADQAFETFATDIVWRPDSSGAFLITGSEIYSMNIPNGDIKLVETDLIADNYHSTYAWINGQ